MRENLLRKENEAIAFIRKFYRLALSMQEDGFHVAFFRRKRFTGIACTHGTVRM
ncbi:hypothetical protein EZS27_011993 [termite gut metagenome]|uniref:Uncharacterized protein n=1 Tax=termite gut metagenome TaxID=433724 RepID=A0A5J4S473_9ZZZZ